MRLEFQPISSVRDVEEWQNIVEILAVYNGSCSTDDLEWDEDELLTSIIDETPDNALKADYSDEPQFGIQIAKDQFLAELFEKIRDRQAILGRHSPFEFDPTQAAFLTRKPLANTSSASLAYIWLVMFWVVNSSKDYTIIDKEEKERFLRNFTATFELICCLVMVARIQGGVWYLGDSRNVHEFVRRLTAVVAVAGTGEMKEPDQLRENQVGANDAGVDILAIEMRHGQVQRDAIAYLVGATIQKSGRRNKIMGIDEVQRFTDYFQRRPALVYNGVLAIPFPGTQAEALDCADRRCMYITKDEILEMLGLFPDDGSRAAYVTSPRRKIFKRSRDLQRVSSVIAKAGELRINWA